MISSNAVKFFAAWSGREISDVAWSLLESPRLADLGQGGVRLWAVHDSSEHVTVIHEASIDLAPMLPPEAYKQGKVPVWRYMAWHPAFALVLAVSSTSHVLVLHAPDADGLKNKQELTAGSGPGKAPSDVPKLACVAADIGPAQRCGQLAWCTMYNHAAIAIVCSHSVKGKPSTRHAPAMRWPAPVSCLMIVCLDGALANSGITVMPSA
jgi:hypothetical protein